jgi:hypothetical protein
MYTVCEGADCIPAAAAMRSCATPAVKKCMGSSQVACSRLLLSYTYNIIFMFTLRYNVMETSNMMITAFAAAATAVKHATAAIAKGCQF